MSFAEARYIVDRRRMDYNHHGPGNILVQQLADGEKRLVLAGLEEIRPIRWTKKADRLSMLVRAQSATQNWSQISRTVRLRFLLKYLEQISQPRDKWKWYWREIRKKGLRPEA